MKKLMMLVSILTLSTGMYRVSADSTTVQTSMIDKIISTVQELSALVASSEDPKVKENYEKIAENAKEIIKELKELPYPRTSEGFTQEDQEFEDETDDVLE